MIVTDKYVFIHLHKTGGQFISQAILNNDSSARQIGYHYPLSLLPDEFKHLPEIGFVRNPWDWYVSWYNFNAKRNTGNQVFQVLSDNNTLDFNTVVTRLVNLGTDEGKVCREKIIKLLPDTLKNNRGIGLTKQCLTSFDDGFLSWQFNRMFSVNNVIGNVHFGRLENIRNDFTDILNKLNVDITASLKNFIDQTPPINALSHSKYQSYYDETLMQLVADKDKEFIKRFNYKY